jgi:hypothetical protein
MSLKGKRFLLGAYYHGLALILCLAGLLLGEVARAPALAGLAVLGLLVHILAFRLDPVGRFIQERLIQQAECPACGDVVDLVDTWSCACGFVTWRPRHAFSPCCNCGRVMSWIVCPGCEASIPI